MRVLIACEESQTVCKEFRAKGHEAYSCDIQQCSGGHPEWHICGDAVGILGGGTVETMDGKKHEIPKWDLLIAHPPCTYLSNAGACRLYPQKGVLYEPRVRQGILARDFFMDFWKFNDIEKVCVENPIPSSVFMLPKYTQVVQPYEYGEPFTKKTCLWLRGLEKLTPTNVITEDVHPYICGNSEIWKRQAANGKVWGKEKSAKHRAKTFVGIAKAMAEQWG